MKEYNFDQDNEDYNLVQQFWYKDKMIYQNCGIDSEMVGEYNGYTIYQKVGEENEDIKAVLHTTLQGCKPMSIEEMKEKIINYEKIRKVVDKQINWEKAIKHLEKMREAARAIGWEGSFYVMGCNELQARYDSGERTEELYKAMIELH